MTRDIAQRINDWERRADECPTEPVYGCWHPKDPRDFLPAREIFEDKHQRHVIDHWLRVCAEADDGLLNGKFWAVGSLICRN